MSKSDKMFQDLGYESVEPTWGNLKEYRKPAWREGYYYRLRITSCEQVEFASIGPYGFDESLPLPFEEIAACYQFIKEREEE